MVIIRLDNFFRLLRLQQCLHARSGADLSRDLFPMRYCISHQLLVGTLSPDPHAGLFELFRYSRPGHVAFVLIKKDAMVTCLGRSQVGERLTKT